MLLCDTGPIVAALNRADSAHEACAALLRKHADELVAPAPVVTETALFLLASYGESAHLRFLDTVASAEIEVVDLTPEDHRQVARLCSTYRDLPLDQVDASVIVVADRLGERRVATLDRRDFTVVRLADGGTLELLPELG